MYSYLKIAHGINKTSLSYYSQLLDRSLSLKSLVLAKIVHAQLIKVGFNGHTFLGNRLIDVYSRFGAVHDAFKVFDDIVDKNLISWNICLQGMLKCGYLETAHGLFDKMPERDVVTWNSMISGYASCGFSDYALRFFKEMLVAGVRPSKFTFSILMSTVSSACHGKEIHGSMIRRRICMSNVVLGNSLIGMYGKFDFVEYAFGVFLTMEELDIISWNSLISCCCKMGYEELSMNQFYLMRSAGYSPDEFTISTIVTVCSNLHSLDKGKQVFSLSFKMGLLSNPIVSGATIDLFAKCNRLEDSIQLFEEVEQWCTAICNAMISSYVMHGLWEDALTLFVLTMRENIRPTDFTLSSVLSSIPILLVEQGRQVHALIGKLGFESDSIVASSLLEMYTKFGLVDPARKIFNDMGVRDLISWNTMITGLTRNGKIVETLDVFKELLTSGPPPDRISFGGVLMACNYGGFVDEGIKIFSLMVEEYGIIPEILHYAWLVDLLCQGGKLEEALHIAETMPYEPNSSIWRSILCACAIHGSLRLTEKVAMKMMEFEPWSTLPYLVLAREYEMRGRWEEVVRMRKGMKEKHVKKVTSCSWIGIRNHVYTFEADQLHNHGEENIYYILRLLDWEMEG